MQTHYAISDLLVNELRKSIAAFSDFFQKFEVFLRSADMSSTENIDCTKRLKATQKLMLNSQLTDCLHFLSTQRSQTPQDAVLTLRANSLSATYPNVDVALRIYLCNFRTGERTSSALKRVKDELSTTNSTMAQSLMTALSLLCIQCIENDIVERLQFDVVIDKMPNRQQEECQLFSNRMHSLP